MQQYKIDPEKILDLRLSRKIRSQRQLAQISGVSNQTISHIERGIVEPSFSSACKIMLALEVYDIRELM
jgi:transcriptional regulator with XRE-family HTH domain